MKRRLITPLSMALVLCTFGALQAQLAVTSLQPDGSPAPKDFTAQKGKPRLLIVLSPT